MLVAFARYDALSPRSATYKGCIKKVVVESVCLDNLDTGIQPQNNEDECHRGEAPQKSQHHGSIPTNSSHNRVVHLVDKRW